MYRIRRGSVLPAFLPVLVAVGILTIQGWTGAPAEASQASATSPPAAAASPVRIVPYLSLGMSRVRSQDTQFVDGGDAGHAGLYGTNERFDDGAVDNGLQLRLAAGLRLPYRLRAQLELAAARTLDWRGNTNYRASGEHQPSGARLDTRQLLLAGFHDFPGWELAPDRTVQPFLGAGLGVTRYHLDSYVQRFPEPDDPQGSLRRGPGGEIPFTVLPAGSGHNLTWMLTAGIAIPISGKINLDLSYRYADAGAIRTDIGDIAIVRYREDGTRREIPVRINETSADYRTHAWLMTLRVEF